MYWLSNLSCQFCQFIGLSNSYRNKWTNLTSTSCFFQFLLLLSFTNSDPDNLTFELSRTLTDPGTKVRVELSGPTEPKSSLCWTARFHRGAKRLLTQNEYCSGPHYTVTGYTHTIHLLYFEYKICLCMQYISLCPDISLIKLNTYIFGLLSIFLGGFGYICLCWIFVFVRPIFPLFSLS